MAYKGIPAKIPLGDYGLLTDAAGDKVPANALIEAKNVVLFNGTVQKAPGTVKYNTTPLTAGIVGMFDYWPDISRQRIICATSDGKLWRDIGGRDFLTQTPINTGMGSLQPNCQFVSGGLESGGRQKRLFFFSYGLNQLQVLTGDGTSFSPILAPSTDWTATNYPKTGTTHRSRLWAFAGQIAYASDTGDHTNFATNTLTMAVFPGEGGEIKGCFTYKTRLFVFKDGGFVYILNETDTTSTNWYWQKIGSNLGLASPNAIDEVIDDLLAGNTSGMLSQYVTTQNTGNFEAVDFLKELQVAQYFRGNLNRSGTGVQHMTYYPDKKLLFTTYRTGYYTYNNELLVVDFNRQTPRVSTWPKGRPDCLALRRDVNLIARPIYGDSLGYIHMMDWETRTEGGTSYEGSFQTAHTDFSYLDQSLGAKEKHFDWLAVTYVPEGPHALSCDFFIDGRYVDTITFPMDQFTENELDTAVLGTARLGEANTETVIRKLRGTGRTFSAKFYNAGSNQSFQVSSITVGFRPGAEKVQR